MSEPQAEIVLVSIGNTRARLAAASGSTLEPSRVVECADPGALEHAVLEMTARYGVQRVLIASVNQPAADRLNRALAQHGDLNVQRIGADIPIPIPHTLSDAATVGQDRLLNALGAFARSQQACIIVDAGTAVTVDFVDGEGTFHGGAIAPGMSMMRDALHEHTAALPKADIAPQHLHASPEAPFGKNTVEAINLGVTGSIVGLVHLLIDRYAEYYEAYPRVVATGGDAPFLFEHDELVESIVPDLPLIGMLTAWELAS
ncbi:MAG: type III pantothenate kinase [Phycisphaerales bacterium]